MKNGSVGSSSAASTPVSLPSSPARRIVSTPVPSRAATASTSSTRTAQPISPSRSSTRLPNGCAAASSRSLIAISSR